MKLNLTDDQLDIAEKLREIIVAPPSCVAERGCEPTSFEHWQDAIRALACIMDGINKQVHPRSMYERFTVAWKAIAVHWTSVKNQILLDALGGDEDFFDHIKSHPKGRNVINRILERASQGESFPVGDFPTTIVSQILSEEMDIDVDDGFDDDDAELN